MSVRLKHAVWSLYGFATISTFIILIGLLLNVSGDSTTPKKDATIRLLTPPSKVIK